MRTRAQKQKLPTPGKKEALENADKGEKAECAIECKTVQDN